MLLARWLVGPLARWPVGTLAVGSLARWRGGSIAKIIPVDEVQLLAKAVVFL